MTTEQKLIHIILGHLERRVFTATDTDELALIGTQCYELLHGDSYSHHVTAEQSRRLADIYRSVLDKVRAINQAAA